MKWNDRKCKEGRVIKLIGETPLGELQKVSENQVDSMVSFFHFPTEVSITTTTWIEREWMLNQMKIGIREEKLNQLGV